MLLHVGTDIFLSEKYLFYIIYSKIKTERMNGDSHDDGRFGY